VRTAVNEIICPGLPAGWINGWLAAVGATVLDPRIQLRWTEEHLAALTCAAGVDPVVALVESWPGQQLLADIPIAEQWHGAGILRRQVSVEDFQDRARAVRTHEYSWTLSSTMTDLCVDDKGRVMHAPFDPAGPGTIKWLHHRLLKVWAKAPVSEARILGSLTGHAGRVEDNGLGFDQTRLGSLADNPRIMVDPIIEVLAFFGLALLPVRGRGIDERLHRQADLGPVQRGWRKLPDARYRCFCWPAWCQRLDRYGIDALLDAWVPGRKGKSSRLGIRAAWRSVGYERRASADNTRAYGGERL